MRGTFGRLIVHWAANGSVEDIFPTSGVVRFLLIVAGSVVIKGDSFANKRCKIKSEGDAVIPQLGT